MDVCVIRQSVPVFLNESAGASHQKRQKSNEFIKKSSNSISEKVATTSFYARRAVDLFTMRAKIVSP